MLRSRRKRKVEKIDLERRGSNCVKAISASDTLMMFPSRRDCQPVLWRMIMITRTIMTMMIMRMMIMAIIMTMIMVVSSSCLNNLLSISGLQVDDLADSSNRSILPKEAKDQFQESILQKEAIEDDPFFRKTSGTKVEKLGKEDEVFRLHEKEGGDSCKGQFDEQDKTVDSEKESFGGNQVSESSESLSQVNTYKDFFFFVIFASSTNNVFMVVTSFS